MILGKLFFQPAVICILCHILKRAILSPYLEKTNLISWKDTHDYNVCHHIDDFENIFYLIVIHFCV